MNDQGIYGFGQLATILRARYCEPKIESVTKTDGLTFRVKEILEATFRQSIPDATAPVTNGSTQRHQHRDRHRARRSREFPPRAIAPG